MKKHLTTIAILSLLSPSITAAEIMIQNSGSVTSKTSSSVSTGGNEVDSGGTVVTGNASASSKSEITSGSNGGTVHIETSTEVNGEKQTQVVEKTLRANEPISVEVHSKSVSGKRPETSITVNGEEQADSGFATVTAETVVRSDPPHTNVFVSLGTRLSAVIKSFFSALRFW